MTSFPVINGSAIADGKSRAIAWVNPRGKIDLVSFKDKKNFLGSKIPFLRGIAFLVFGIYIFIASLGKSQLGTKTGKGEEFEEKIAKKLKVSPIVVTLTISGAIGALVGFLGLILIPYFFFSMLLDKGLDLYLVAFIMALLRVGLLILILWIYIFIVVKDYKTEKINKIYFILLIIFSILFTYIGGKFYRYYILLLLPYMLFSLIYLFYKYKPHFNKYSLFIVIVILIGYTYLNANYKDNILKSKNDYAQYIFADEINKYENATVFNYQTLDTGIYFTSNIVPNVKYFHQINISKDNFETVFVEQDRYIKEELVDFVVMKTHRDLKFLEKYYKDLFLHYELVKEKQQLSDGILKTYYLFRLKSL